MPSNLFGTQAQLEHAILVIQTRIAELTLQFSKLAELNKKGDCGEAIDQVRTQIADLASIIVELSLSLIAPSDG